MQTSEQIGELAAALAKAQAAMKNAPLTKTNPHYRSKYSDLAAIRDAVVPHLAAHGIALVQGLDGLAVSTRLLHTSGQWIESTLPIPAGKMQELGSAITYARRYTLSAICGIAADEDDDGNVANTVDDDYLDWVASLESDYAGAGIEKLTDVVKAPAVPEAWRARLRSETATWARLKKAAQVAA